MFKITSGWKKENRIWEYLKYNAVVDKSTCHTEYFKYNAVVDKSTCHIEYLKYNAVVDKSTCHIDNNCVICDRLISRKNSTNLKTHWKSSHPANFDDYKLKEKQRKVIEPVSKSSSSASRMTRSPYTTSTGDLPILLNRRPTLWPQESKEVELRDDGLLVY